MALSQVLTQEIVSAQSDPRYFLFDGIPVIPDDTVKFLLGGDFDKYDLILKDSKAKALLEVRTRNVVCREWVVTPASDKRIDKKAADIVKQVLLGFDFDQACSSLHTTATLKGNSFVEIKWAIDGATTYIDQATAKPNHRFRFILHNANNDNVNQDEIGIFDGYEIRALSQGNFYLGDQVPAKRILTHNYGRMNDNPYGIGLGRVLYWMAVIFKKEIWKQRLIYLDQYAAPTKLGKPPSDDSLNRSTKEQRDQFRDAMDDIIKGKVGVLPPGWGIDLLEASRSSTSDVFQSALESINSEMAMLVLGETLSMELPSGNGSRAATESHAEGSGVYLAKYDSDRMSTGVLRDLARWITALNVPDAKPPMIWRSFPELDTVEDLNTRAGRDFELKNVGYQISAEKVKEIYGDGYIDLAAQAKQQQEDQAKQQQEQAAQLAGQQPSGDDSGDTTSTATSAGNAGSSGSGGAFDIGFSERDYQAIRQAAFRARLNKQLVLPARKILVPVR